MNKSKIDVSKIPRDELEVLLLAVIKQAIDDYTNSEVKGQKSLIINGIRYDVKKEVEDFFYSDYFNMLSSSLNLFDEFEPNDLMVLLDDRTKHYIWKKKHKCSKCRNYKCPIKSKNSFGRKEVCLNEV